MPTQMHTPVRHTEPALVRSPFRQAAPQLGWKEGKISRIP